MRKWITFLMTFLVVGSASSVNATMGDLNAFAGYRHDTIEWKHRVPSRDPVLKEKTRYKNIDIFQIGVNARSTIGCNFYARAEATFGWVLDGDVRRKSSIRGADSDYGINEEKFKNVIDDRYVYDINAAIGYPFYFCDCTAVLAPVIGYAFDSQNLGTYENNFGFDSYNACDNGGCCKNKSIFRWYGPFVGVDFNYRPFHDCWNFYAAFEYHWGRTKLRQSPDDENSFNSHCWMDGWVVDIGADYELCDQWTVGLYLKFTDFAGSKRQRWNGGYSDSYSDDSGCKAKHHLYWTSYAVNLELGKQF